MTRTTLALTASMVLSMQIYAGESDIAPVESATVIPVLQGETNDWFIYLAGGFSSLDVTSSVTLGADIFPDALDDKGSLIELGAGYRLSDNIFTTLAGQRTNLDFVTLDTVYASVNYQFSNVILKPYIGALAGYSKLSWDTRPHLPHVVPFNEDLSSTAGVYGIQAGVEQALGDSWSLFVKYQYLKYNQHIMEIDAAATTIEHNKAQNILGGIRYAF